MTHLELPHGAVTGPAGLWTVLGLGFVLGLRHALDADHLVAVSTIASRAKTGKAALVVGALWGLGHALTILVVGGAIVAFGVIVPARLEAALEFCVALMLIALGAFNIWFAARRKRGPSDAAAEQRLLALRPVAVGVVHGLAGSAAVALLVLTTIESATRAVIYLLVFGVGTTCGMAILTSFVVMPVAAASRRVAGLERYLSGFTGIASLAFGAVLAVGLAREVLG